LPFGAHALAFLELINSGSDEDLQLFVEQRMDAEFQHMPLERHRGFIAQMRGDLNGETLTLRHVVRAEPYLLELYSRTESSARWYLIVLEFDEFPPHPIGWVTAEAVDGAPVPPP
jgi:hypothetical protein